MGLIFINDSRLVKKVYKESRRQFLERKKSNWIKTIYGLVQKYNLECLWNEEIGNRVSRDKKYWLKIILENIHK